MIVILEGLDKTGKTTFANKICAKFGFKYIKVSQPVTNNPFMEYLSLIDKLNLNENYICDRMYLGERVYGPIYRGNDLTDEQQLYLEMYLLRHKLIFVYCEQDISIINENFKKKNEEFTKIKDIESLILKYQIALSKSILPIFRYSYSRKLDEYLVFKLIENKLKTSNYFFVSFPFLGTLQKNIKYLLIGDELNLSKGKRVFNSVSGMFLFKILRMLHQVNAINLLDTVIINSKYNNKPFYENILFTMNFKNVIALGEKANNVLQNNLDYRNISQKVVHPQFAKRFFGKSAKAVKKYFNMFMEVLK